MRQIIEWIKNNKLLALVVAFLLFSFIKNSFSPIYYSNMMYRTSDVSSTMDTYSYGVAGEMGMPVSAPVMNFNAKSAPNTIAQADRKTVESSSLSVVVTDVSTAINSTQSKAESFGGYVVSSNVSRPNESTSGDIVVRVPGKNKQEFVDHVKSLGLKTISETYSGYDITDQYIDNEARLATLNQTKAKFEEIFAQAVKVEDILRVQNEIINIQNQIDSIKGQQQAYDQMSSTVRLGIYFASDEYSLPYAPDTNWRPDVVFKLAVRSLVLSLRNIASLAIWLAVYAVVWLPILLLGIFIWKKFNKPVALK